MSIGRQPAGPSGPAGGASADLAGGNPAPVAPRRAVRTFGTRLRFTCEGAGYWVAEQAGEMYVIEWRRPEPGAPSGWWYFGPGARDGTRGGDYVSEAAALAAHHAHRAAGKVRPMVAAPIHRVGLVACGAAKGDHKAPARQLYTSGLFRAASRYAEHAYDCWYVVSAFYGLVDPEQVLIPYDRSLAGLRRRERDAWGCRVADELRRRLQAQGLRVPRVPKGRPWPHEPEVEVWIHAGKTYAEALLWPLSLWPSIVQRPLAGLRIGQQLHWYADRRASSHAL